MEPDPSPLGVRLQSFLVHTSGLPRSGSVAGSVLASGVEAPGNVLTDRK